MIRPIAGKGYEDQGWSSIWGAPAIMHHSQALMADHRFWGRDYFRFTTTYFTPLDSVGKCDPWVNPEGK